jgi:membrane-bound lytic murein transglycosylase D
LQCIPQYLRWGLLFNAIFSFFLTIFLLINSDQVHAESFYEYFVSQQKFKDSNISKNDNNISVSKFYNLNLIISSTPSIKFYTEMLEEEKLPIDLAVIPLLESGNNPLAQSPKNAVGLWQFMPSTGKEWGLFTEKTDSRSNVVKSTQIAIQYLKYLHGELNDWDLTLAAYNWGIGSVKKALKNGLVTNNVINLKKLPTETRKYIIAFHHLNRLIRENVKDPELSKFPNIKYLVRIKQSDISNFISSDKLTAVDHSFLKHINGYDPYKIGDLDRIALVPSKGFQKYFSTLKISYKELPSKQGCSNKFYKTQYRDTFQSLARMYKLRVDLLKEMNSHITFLRPGMTIRLC